MYRTTPHPRGMALVMAMIVVVLMTLLVAGAISFTGTERAASEIQMQEDTMSACVQAARNLFVSQIQMADPAFTQNIIFNETLQIDPTDPTRTVTLRTGHLGQAPTSSAEESTSMQNPDEKAGNLNSTDPKTWQAQFYTVTAVCREGNNPNSPEREIEFMVRVGL